MKTSAKWIPVLLCCVSCARVYAADETAAQAAVEAVHAWYQTLGNGSDQEHLKEFGTVGGGVGPLMAAHQQLAAQLKARMDRDQFLVHYRGLAHMRLLQAHAVATSARGNYAQVFVEEERVMAIEGLPAMAWFEGLIEVTKTQEGWRISSLEQVKPEDLIDTLADHSPALHGDPVDVAMTHLQCKSEDCTVMRKAFPPPNATERLGRVTIQTPRGVNTVSLARLHDGEWVCIDTEAETTTTPK